MMWNGSPHGVERVAFIGVGTFDAVGVYAHRSSVFHWTKENS